MRRRPPRSTTLAEWPPVLRHIHRAAERECPEGHADALRELTILALQKVPSRGIFDPTVRGEDELFAAIESVAQAHLELSDARAAWRTALRDASLRVDVRDGIERAAVQVQTVSDTAYFYAGLAFGLVAASVYRLG